jgi:hypothetical protein
VPVTDALVVRAVVAVVFAVVVVMVVVSGCKRPKG